MPEVAQKGECTVKNSARKIGMLLDQNAITQQEIGLAVSQGVDFDVIAGGIVRAIAQGRLKCEVESACGIAMRALEDKA